MGQYIDIGLFAGLAVFLVFVLRGVLGRRTGTERPPAQIMPRTATMPGRATPVGGRAMAPGPVIDATAERSDTPAAGLAAIAAADPHFSADSFLAGAQQAFEMIVKAFAAGDTATLRPLVDDEVYDTFTEVIRGRLSRKETAETKITRMQRPEIMAAELVGRTARIAVRFASAQISVTRGGDGAIVDGDPERVMERADIWTFARNTRSTDPNWFLVATATPEK